MEDLNQILLTKPAEVVQEAHQMLEKHGWHVKMLKSELYIVAHFVCQVMFRVLHYAMYVPTV